MNPLAGLELPSSVFLRTAMAAAISVVFQVSTTMPVQAAEKPHTVTPIKHVVVIFQENVSFDHYFATYPHAVNPDSEPRFSAGHDTPTVNGLSDGLLKNNPQRRGAVPPFSRPSGNLRYGS